MNFRRRFGRELFLVILVAIFESVSSSSNGHSKAKRFVDTSGPGDPLFLTELLKTKSSSDVLKEAQVIHPEIPSDLKPVAGYLTVNETNNSNLFFLHIPATKVDSKSAPVILYLEGGPGKTLFFNLFLQHGPFWMTSSGSVKMRDGTWNSNYNMIYVDSPVGTGFSFTDSEDGYAKTQTDVAGNLLVALLQFFQMCPHLTNNHFYVAGESYAAKTVPAVAYAIDRHNVRSPKKKINLKGIVIGNGFMDPPNQLKFGRHLHNLGLIGSKAKYELESLELEASNLIAERDYTAAYDTVSKLTDNLMKNIRYCSAFDIRETEFKRNPYKFVNWVQRFDVRQALHVGAKPFSVFSEKVKNHFKQDMTTSETLMVARLLKTYRVLIYTGNLNIACPYSAVQDYLVKFKSPDGRNLTSAKREEWRFPDGGKGILAGYKRKFGNLCEVLVRNVGHFPSLDQPQWILQLLDQFVKGTI